MKKRTPLGWLVLLPLTLGIPVASAQIAFTDVSASAGIDRRGESYGASWSDFNGDGYPDIFASNHRQRPSLFLNLGNGSFFETGGQVLVWRNRSRADTHGGAWQDVDNDGDQDLLVSTGTGNYSQLLINENQRFVDRAVERGLGIANVGGRLPVWLDYDGDTISDFVMTQYGGIAKVFRQDASGTFTETTGTVKIVCKRFMYGHLYDVTSDGRLDLLCPDEEYFPQKIYSTLPTPWQKLFDSTAPNGLIPIVEKVADSVLADFDNDGRMDVFLLSGVQLRPSSVVQGTSTHLESQLTGGTKGFRFVTAGKVTFGMDWNKSDNEQSGTNVAKIQIGAGARNPAAIPFTLDPADPTVAGMPPPPTLQSQLPLMQIGFDPATNRWTLVLQTKLTPESPNIFSEAYVLVDATSGISDVQGTGLWPSDKSGRPTLLMNTSGGFVDTTVAANLAALVSCGSVTAGDFDNDMDVDLYLACRTGASNLPNILYANRGDGTFEQVANAGGAAGPVGVAFESGAGTADSAISADFDVDGFLDLFVTNGFNLRPLGFGGPSSLFRNAGNSNRWIQVDLVGRQSNRDAEGARIYATVGTSRQMRVQNGYYHRWSQDLKRAHFGLGSAAQVDLRVEWPSGNVQTFTGVAANALYRITEGVGISRVTLGQAPAYPCGPPTIKSSVDAALFVWRDCPSGEWRIKAAAGGGSIGYRATIRSGQAYIRVKPVTLETDDSLDYQTDPTKIVLSFNTTRSNTDGVNFLAQDGAGVCLNVTAPAGAQVLYGPFRKQVSFPIDLVTQKPCTP